MSVCTLVISDGQLEDTRRLADSEARDRATLLGKFRSLEADLERLKEKIEAENEAKADIQKAMARAQAEAQVGVKSSLCVVCPWE